MVHFLLLAAFAGLAISHPVLDKRNPPAPVYCISNVWKQSNGFSGAPVAVADAAGALDIARNLVTSFCNEHDGEYFGYPSMAAKYNSPEHIAEYAGKRLWIANEARPDKQNANIPPSMASYWSGLPLKWKITIHLDDQGDMNVNYFPAALIEKDVCIERGMLAINGCLLSLSQTGIVGQAPGIWAPSRVPGDYKSYALLIRLQTTAEN